MITLLTYPYETLSLVRKRIHHGGHPQAFARPLQPYELEPQIPQPPKDDFGRRPERNGVHPLPPDVSQTRPEIAASRSAVIPAVSYPRIRPEDIFL